MRKERSAFGYPSVSTSVSMSVSIMTARDHAMGRTLDISSGICLAQSITTDNEIPNASITHYCSTKSANISRMA